jgi:hypothetical protein
MIKDQCYEHSLEEIETNCGRRLKEKIGEGEDSIAYF